MNNVYIYDGDFVSLLNLTLYLIKNNFKPTNIKKDNYNSNLFENVIKLSIPKDESIIDKVTKYYTKYILKIMYYVFLSEDENKELIIYYFFLNTLKYQANVINYRNLKCVSEALRISEYVSHEAHKMKGFLRFKELNGNILYAEMAPSNDILFLVSCHFLKRLKNEFWIIKDCERGIISIYDKKKFVIVDENDFKLSELKMSKTEEITENLWKTFYKTIGIKERKNDRCRMNFMPKKYWKYITEVKEEI